jgi:hypothetical protein
MLSSDYLYSKWVLSNKFPCQHSVCIPYLPHPSNMPRSSLLNFPNLTILSELYQHDVRRCVIPRTDHFLHTSFSNSVINVLRGGIAQWYSSRLRAGWSGVRIPAGAGNFSLHHRIQTGSGAHGASYSMGSRRSSPGGKAVGAWSWPLTSIWCRGQRMRGAISPLPQYTFMMWCPIKAQG